MTCDHCAMSATGKGKKMEWHVYMQALQFVIRHGEMITIGGGEPTTHNEFFDFLEKTIEFYDCGSLEAPPFVITNGKAKTKAHRLLDMIEDGQSFHVELSQDRFHDPIDPSVVRRFKQHQQNKDMSRWSGGNYHSSAGIRTVREIIPVGRAVDTGVYTTGHNFKCACEDIFIDPLGNVFSCGCRKHRLGTIWDGDFMSWYSRDYAHVGGRDPEEYEIGCESVVSDEPDSVVDEPPVNQDLSANSSQKIIEIVPVSHG